MKALRWLLLLWMVPALAETPDEFAYGLRVETPPGGAIYRLSLPEELYRGVTRDDLGDLRVFNGRGDPVPHAVRAPEIRPGAASAPIPVPLFPLLAEAAGGPSELQIRIDEHGALVGARSGGEQAAAVEAYVLDLSGLDEPPGRIELNVTGGDFAVRAALAVSDDLAHWRPVGEASLAHLSHAGALLERRAFDLSPGSGGKYLRIAWPAGARKASVTGALATATTPVEGPDRRWSPVEARRMAGAVEAYEFSRPGALPIDRVRVIPSEPNTVVRVRLLSRPSEASPWRLRASRLVHDLATEGGRLVSDPIEFSGADRLWRLEAEQGSFGRSVPRVDLGWVPRQLLFVARGEPPFLLAYGSAAAKPMETTLDPLLADPEAGAALVRDAAVGDAVPLGGAARTVVQRTIPWQRLVLWALLVGGVGALGFMAWRLARQLR